MKRARDVAMIIPAHNEADVIEETVMKAKRVMDAISKSYSIVISENGSIDETYEVAKSLVERYPGKVTTIHIDKAGKGIAINTAVSRVKADLYLMIDADMPVESIDSFKALIDEARKHGIASGSRNIPGSISFRPVTRRILSLLFNLLTRLLFRGGSRDYLCGFKAFRKDVTEKVIPKIKSEGWFWDVEFIIKARNEGFSLVEIPVIWKERRKSKMRSLRAVPSLAFDLIKLRLGLM